MSNSDNTLVNKVSSQIQSQLPEFIQADHPIFGTFIRKYFEFLESAELSFNNTNSFIIQELEGSSNVLQESGSKILNEVSELVFYTGETLTGQTSKATCTVLSDDLSLNKKVFVTSNTQFIIGEKIVGSNGGSGTISNYRINPIQNIQQLIDYANVDSTIHQYLDNFRDMLLEGMVDNLDSQVDKRKLIKNIRDLYVAKGTEKAHKLFFELLFDETPVITYPTDNVLRSSDGNWTDRSSFKAKNLTGDLSQIFGQVMTGRKSRATAIPVSGRTTVSSGITIYDIEVDTDSIAGTFTDGEIVSVTSADGETTITFEIQYSISSLSITSTGSYYNEQDLVSIEDNTVDTNSVDAKAQISVFETGSGKVDGLFIDDSGTGHAVNDTINFNNTGTGGSGVSAKVSVVGGGISPESGDLTAYGMSATDHIVMEDFTESFMADTYFGNKLVLETNTFTDLGVASESGEITDIRIISRGNGYTKLPLISSITSTSGASAKLVPFSTSGVGSLEQIIINDSGSGYTANPSVYPSNNVLIKDISGTFVVGEELTSSHSAPFELGQVISGSDSDRLEKSGLTTEELKNTHYAFGVDISGDYAIAGAPYEDVNDSHGAIYFYKFNSVSKTWSFLQRIDIDETDRLVLNGTNTSQDNKGDGVLTEDGSFIQLDNEFDYDQFGREVAISGDTAIVTRNKYPNSSRGGIHVYVRQGEIFVEQTVLFLDNKIVLNGTDSDSTNAGDNLCLEDGSRIDIDYTTSSNGSPMTLEESVIIDGNMVLEDNTGNLLIEGDSGSATGTLIHEEGNQVTYFSDHVVESFDGSGYTPLNIDVKGDIIVAGFERENIIDGNNANKINIRHGSELSSVGDLLLEQSRGKVVLEDSTIDENDFRNISESGAVFVFQRSGSTWTAKQRLTMPIHRIENTDFANHTLTIQNHDLSTGTKLIYEKDFNETSGLRFNGDILEDQTELFVIKVDDNKIKLCTNRTDALAGTSSVLSGLMTNENDDTIALEHGSSSYDFDSLLLEDAVRTTDTDSISLEDSLLEGRVRRVISLEDTEYTYNTNTYNIFLEDGTYESTDVFPTAGRAFLLESERGADFGYSLSLDEFSTITTLAIGAPNSKRDNYNNTVTDIFEGSNLNDLGEVEGLRISLEDGGSLRLETGDANDTSNGDVMLTETGGIESFNGVGSAYVYTLTDGGTYSGGSGVSSTSNNGLLNLNFQRQGPRLNPFDSSALKISVFGGQQYGMGYSVGVGKDNIIVGSNEFFDGAWVYNRTGGASDQGNREAAVWNNQQLLTPLSEEHVFTGTVSIDAGSHTVTGVGTSFTTDYPLLTEAGDRSLTNNQHFIVIPGAWYNGLDLYARIQKVDSDTQITLDSLSSSESAQRKGITAKSGITSQRGVGYGTSTVATKQMVLVGAQYDGTIADSSGSIYQYSQSISGEWTSLDKLKADTPTSGDLFGREVHLEDDNMITSMPSRDNNTGALNIFIAPFGKVISFDSDRQLLKVETKGQLKSDETVTTTNASGIVLQSDTSQITSTVGDIATVFKGYEGKSGLISINENRLHDSNYYQDYSYVISVGQSINTWRDAVKSTIHPSGWNLFGLFDSTSSAIGTPSLPIRVGEVFDQLLQSIFGRRLGTSTQLGEVNVKLETETDATGILRLEDGSASNSGTFGFKVIYDEALLRTDDVRIGNVTLEDDMRELTLTKQTVVSIESSVNKTPITGSTLDILPRYAFGVPSTVGERIPEYPSIVREGHVIALETFGKFALEDDSGFLVQDAFSVGSFFYDGKSNLRTNLQSQSTRDTSSFLISENETESSVHDGGIILEEYESGYIRAFEIEVGTDGGNTGNISTESGVFVSGGIFQLSTTTTSGSVNTPAGILLIDETHSESGLSLDNNSESIFVDVGQPLYGLKLEESIGGVLINEESDTVVERGLLLVEDAQFLIENIILENGSQVSNHKTDKLILENIQIVDELGSLILEDSLGNHKILNEVIYEVSTPKRNEPESYLIDEHFDSERERQKQDVILETGGSLKQESISDILLEDNTGKLNLETLFARILVESSLQTDDDLPDGIELEDVGSGFGAIVSETNTRNIQESFILENEISGLGDSLIFEDNMYNVIDSSISLEEHFSVSSLNDDDTFTSNNDIYINRGSIELEDSSGRLLFQDAIDVYTDDSGVRIEPQRQFDLTDGVNTNNLIIAQFGNVKINEVSIPNSIRYDSHVNLVIETGTDDQSFGLMRLEDGTASDSGTFGDRIAFEVDETGDILMEDSLNSDRLVQETNSSRPRIPESAFTTRTDVGLPSHISVAYG